MMTVHANKRKQQRGIRPEAISLLLNHGECFHEKGADIYKMTKRAVKEMVAEGNSRQVLDKVRKLYAVTIDGAVITLAHKY
jgi:hypothetical protein